MNLMDFLHLLGDPLVLLLRDLVLPIHSLHVSCVRLLNSLRLALRSAGASEKKDGDEEGYDEPSCYT
jgi:hypothetical protein